MSEQSPSERLTSLETTLSSLKEEGYANEILEPLLREIEVLKAAAAAAPDTASSPPASSLAQQTPAIDKPVSQSSSPAQPMPALVKPFDPNGAASISSPPPPPPPPTRKLAGMQSMRAQSEPGYVPPTGLNPSAELLRRRQEARRLRGEPSGGGGGGGWFANLWLSPEERMAREQRQAAERARIAEEAEAYKEEILAMMAERQRQNAAVRAERERVVAERMETRARELETSRSKMKLEKVMKRAAKNLQVELELYRFSGQGRRDQVDGENAMCREELPGLIQEAEQKGVDAGTVAGSREVLARLEQAAENRAAIA
eukprot:CAMPEP_0119075610 /NCGR_PEP_ID=MMETSP1178-20130426/81854_1 /TAXON_ID=33656 /ORGANISM="unid sp, Strain CCMP2000" /LENGTH=314 /DNA_ID=CAMNT_0007057845 /DNA_START=109 /DNA_END=1053 /DNA_ORIENTATION=-